MFLTLLAALLAAGLVRCFYYGFESKWPSKYGTVNRIFDNAIRQSPLLYLAFRLLPVFLGSLALTTTVERVEGNAWIALAILLSVEVIWTHGRAAFEVARQRSHRYAWLKLMLFHVGAALATVGAGVGAAFARPWLAQTVPSPAAFTEAIWTALLLTSLGPAALRVLEHNPVDTGQRDPRKALSADQIDMVTQEAQTAGAFAPLAIAICAAENRARPGWFRWLERRAGGPGTYGLAQMFSRVPLTDRESVALLCRSIAARTTTGEGFGIPTKVLDEITFNHNPDEDFCKDVRAYLNGYSMRS